MVVLRYLFLLCLLVGTRIPQADAKVKRRGSARKEKVEEIQQAPPATNDTSGVTFQPLAPATGNAPATRPRSQEIILEPLLVPVQFTKDGLSYFFTKVFNDQRYAQTILPNNFGHLVQFLRYGQRTQKPPEYIHSILRLFHHKLKEGTYINGHAFSEMIDYLETSLTPYFKENRPIPVEQIKETLKDLFYSSFLRHFSLFKENPKEFIDGLTNQVYEAARQVSPHTPDGIDRRCLQEMMMRFLEHGLSRLIWSPEDQEEVWTCVKALSRKLAVLKEAHIIDGDDNLNDLYWSLLNSFCHFLDLAGSDLTLNVCATIKDDIEQQSLLFLTLEEHEDMLTPKSAKLYRTLATTEMKILAKDQGIISELIVPIAGRQG